MLYWWLVLVFSLLALLGLAWHMWAAIHDPPEHGESTEEKTCCLLIVTACVLAVVDG